MLITLLCLRDSFYPTFVDRPHGFPLHCFHFPSCFVRVSSDNTNSILRKRNQTQAHNSTKQNDKTLILLIILSRPQVDLTFERFRFLAPCQRLRAIVCVLSAHLRDDESSTCVCLRLREQCLRSEITSVYRVANVLLLRFVAGNVDVNMPASKRSQLIGNTAIVQ